MTIININQAKTHLSRYAKLVKAGETVILCDRNKPFAEIRPLANKQKSKKRKLGQLSEKIECDDAFWESDAEIEADFLSSKLPSDGPGR